MFWGALKILGATVVTLFVLVVIGYVVIGWYLNRDSQEED